MNPDSDSQDSILSSKMFRAYLSEVRRRKTGADSEDDGSADDSGSNLTSSIPGPSAEMAHLLDRLEQLGKAHGRYEYAEEIATGGMGVIWCVRDKDLNRVVVLKTIRLESADDQRAVDRFVAEAEIAAQLEHPGVLSVHDIGLDPEGRFYYTMPYVRGQTLAKIFDSIRQGDPEWTLARALDVLQRVCETMQYAHHKGIIHRDLKPSNIMVGRFGETYVMDWGIARFLERADKHDLRISQGPDATLVVESARKQAPPDSPLVTVEGHAIGTPAYMPPEQARGDLEALDERADVYAVGAMLYELLSGQPPYVRPGEARPTGKELLRRVIAAAPPPLNELGPTAPLNKLSASARRDLVAICEQAMDRRLEHRFRTMDEVVTNLRAHVEHRVVPVAEGGALAQLRKWVARNRGVAALSALVLVVIVASSVFIAASEYARARETRRSLDERLVAESVREADELWPVHPDMLGKMQRWRAQAQSLLDRRGQYDQALAALRPRALPYSEEARSRDRNQPEMIVEIAHVQFILDWFNSILLNANESGNASASNDDDVDVEAQARQAKSEELRRITIEREIPMLESRIATLESKVQARKTWEFRSAEDQSEHDRLAAMIEDYDSLATCLDHIEARIDEVQGLKPDSIASYAAEWRQARAAIATAPNYGGLDIEPQLGLVPLGADKASGLWEFWHTLSGERPDPDIDDKLIIKPETGIVLVLIPGGSMTLGVNTQDDPAAGPAEFEDEYDLQPFFISKYELTQAQWSRLSGQRPSENFPGMKVTGSAFPITQTNPVEHVTWDEARRGLRRWNLRLPTEAQWECAARGGTTERYWTGNSIESIMKHVNFADKSTEQTSTARDRFPPPDYNDHHVNHARVDLFSANPYGLYNVLGNVSEWTLDRYLGEARFAKEVRAGDGERVPKFSNAVTARGGGFENALLDLRVTRRFKRLSNAADEDIGIRPARMLDAQKKRKLR